MAHLAIICDLKQPEEWMRLLLENGADLNESLEFTTIEKAQHLIRFCDLALNLQTTRYCIISAFFSTWLKCLSPFGLAALLGNYLTLETFLTKGNFQVLTLQVHIHSTASNIL